MRISLALFVVALTAFLLAQLATETVAVVAIVGVGLTMIAIFSLFKDPAPILTRVDVEKNDAAERAFIEAISEPVLYVIDGRVRLANAAARTLLGAHIVGEDVRLAVRHPAAADLLAAGAADGNVELVGVGVGGRDQRFALHAATTSPGHRVIHLINQTGRHAVERARVDFVANASHELRTPLAAILGFVETLSDDNAGGDAAIRSRFLEVIFKESRRMQRLIDDLISLSRIESEKYVMPGTLVALPALIDQVAGEVRDGAGESHAVLTLKIDRSVPDIVGEQAQLSQVLHNLIGNAVKYGRSDTPVTVRLKSDGAQLRLSVVDQGDGIAPEHLPRLTERFYRVDSGRSRTLGGTGLGLSIVKHIVERHRGRLEIASRVGVGTTVSIIFPVPSADTVTEPSPN